MDMLVPEWILVLLEKYGMSILIVVNALSQLIGMVKNVKVYPVVLEVKFLIQPTPVFAHKAMYGLKVCAFILHAMEDKLGQDQNAYAHLDFFSMAACACNVSMDKSGIKNLRLAPVILVIDGMASIVKNLLYVRMEEFGIQPINNAFVQTVHIGVDLIVWLYKDVMEANILIQQFKNVHAYQDSNGMEKIAYNVITVEPGMLLH